MVLLKKGFDFLMNVMNEGKEEDEE